MLSHRCWQTRVDCFVVLTRWCTKHVEQVEEQCSVAVTCIVLRIVSTGVLVLLRTVSAKQGRERLESLSFFVKYLFKLHHWSSENMAQQLIDTVHLSALPITDSRMSHNTQQRTYTQYTINKTQRQLLFKLR